MIEASLPTDGLTATTEPITQAHGVSPRSLLNEDFTVLIAGGGVAALEAVLALDELAAGKLSVELICPEREFTLRALSVREPFGTDRARSLDLAGFCARNGATLRTDALAEVWAGRQRVLLDSGEDVFYDALLLAFGAKPHAALPGAHVFRGPPDVGWYGELLDQLEHGTLERVAFAVPGEVRWSLPLYELALMTARRLRDRGVTRAQIHFVTHEPAPLSIFGEQGSDRVAELLRRGGIELTTSAVPVRVEEGRLHLDDGGAIEADEVVALPGLGVPGVPGLPQGRYGFIGTDAEMRVEGAERVWAAGDATWFPIKQGGLAAQQADVAAAGIAAEAGAGNDVPAFRPVVRAALLTGDEPEFLRAGSDDDESEVASHPLWWPPGKVTGKRLAPYLAREWSGEEGDPLPHLEDVRTTGDAGVDHDAEHREAVDLSLRYADVDAAEGELRGALRWLDIAEKLNVTLPLAYDERREEWRRALREEPGRG